MEAAPTARKLRPSKATIPHRARLTLAIDGTPYAVRPARGVELPAGCSRAFILTRSDRRLGKVRHVVGQTPAGLVCSCGDAKYRQLPVNLDCKHLLAARATGLL